MKPTYCRNIDAQNIKEDFAKAPFNLHTMRARRKVERHRGCSYVSEVARILRAGDGEPESSDIAPYSFLAYCANEVHQRYLQRKEHRRLVSLGWNKGCDESMVGKKAIALINGQEKKGRIVREVIGVCFLPARHRRRGYNAEKLYLMAA
jgi:hypothetical protein